MLIAGRSLLQRDPTARSQREQASLDRVPARRQPIAGVEFRRAEAQEGSTTKEPEQSAFAGPGRPDAAASHVLDGPPVDDAEPSRAGLGGLDPSLREHDTLTRLEHAGVEHVFGRLPTAEAVQRG